MSFRAPADRFWLTCFATLLVSFGIFCPLFAESIPPGQRLGDLDGDQIATVRDLVLLRGHVEGTRPLQPALAVLADLNSDGFINDADDQELVREILETRNPEQLPLATVSRISPGNDEGDVALTRETIVDFSIPLAPDTVLDTNHFFAEFGGRKILSRVEVSSDRRKATLFYLEPLPSNARIQITLNAPALTDLLGRPVDLNGDRVPGGSILTQFDTLSITPVEGTAIIGRVFASERGTGGIEVPLSGVTITVDGAEETLRAVTDGQGNFTLSPCPAGTFFVHIDGRTSPQSAWPNGDFYPVVGKRWEAVAGKLDNLSGDSQDTELGTIYLPKVIAGALQTASQTNDTPVALPQAVIDANPALAGTELIVPANSLFSDDGTRGGRVGIAPVGRDRLPSPLPPGLEPPMVITVQTDGGMNFDRSVPVCFPNLADPVTGVKLRPGAKSALWSFNHDIGEWEVVGPMTVTEDGNYVKTDAGVGIRQPGWHGQFPGSSADGPSKHENIPKCPPKSNGNPNQILSSPFREWNGTPPSFNGCGAAGASIDLIPDGFPGIDFSPACNRHDIAYGRYIEYSALEDAWQNANYAMYADMTDLIDEAFENDLITGSQFFVYYTVAAAYYAAVSSSQGWEAFLSAQRALSEYDCEKFQNPGEAPFEVSPEPTLSSASLEPLAENKWSNVWFQMRDFKTGAILRSGKVSYEKFGTLRLVFPSNRRIILTAVNGPDSIGEQDFLTAPDGLHFTLPAINWESLPSDDPDSDQVSSAAELIIGTNPNKPDSDGDGIPDGAELDAGTDPLDGFIAQTGVIASAPTTGRAIDIDAVNNLAITANGVDGVTVFNVLRGLNPLRIAQLSTAGPAMEVAISGNLAAVATMQAGVAIIDLNGEEGVAIASQVNLAKVVQSVATNGDLIYAGTKDGEIATIDAPTGTVLHRVSLASSAPIHSLSVSGDHVYALQYGVLTTLAIDQFSLQRLGTLALPGQVGAGGLKWRLSSGEGTLYATHMRGVNLIDIATNPSSPTLVSHQETAQFGWKQFVANGSGLALGAVGLNSTSDGPHHLDLYSVGSSGREFTYLTTFETPGSATAVSIYNGLAYVADDRRGLQVVSFRPFDSLGVPPSISLEANFPLDHGNHTGTVQEGRVARIDALVSDDIQAKNVEFHVDGALRLIDGNFPFTYRLTTPGIGPEKLSFTVKAKVTDTGGNSTWTPEYVVTLASDLQGPSVVSVLPVNGDLVGNQPTTYVAFSEVIDPETARGGGIRLVGAGPDQVFETADDFLPSIEISERPNLTTLFIEFPQALNSGSYRLEVTTSVQDYAGNALDSPASATFRVVASVDTDFDGIPDDWETEMGYDPGDPDSNDDGTPDGDEDFDGDGVINRFEILSGTNPTRGDSRYDGGSDFTRDSDGDGIPDWKEFALYGTNWLLEDSDGDGFDDWSELLDGTNPADRSSQPHIPARADDVIFLNASPPSLPAGVEALSSPPVIYRNDALP